ncbi:MAG: universal stress protein [Desulfobacteraceae bacterium]|nr:universal stress protein [Desulfobacteraceae bacterium]
MGTKNKRKILIAVDGSDQTLEAVRYIGSIVPPERTEIVLFNVGTGFPEVYWDMNTNPLYRTKKSKVMGWVADSQVFIGEFKEKAFKILSDAGFPENALSVKTQATQTNKLKDIIQESYQEYSAIVAGKTGISRLKDLFLGSMARQLSEKIKHIPVVIVGGKPRSRKILIALDESIEAMRGVSCIGALASGCETPIKLCHCLDPTAADQIGESVPVTGDREELIRKYGENRFRPYMDEAIKRLKDAGVSAERISSDFVYCSGNTIQKIIETAVAGDFGTILVGRREAATFAQEYFRGRFSEKIIKSLDDMAVWVVS